MFSLRRKLALGFGGLLLIILIIGLRSVSHLSRLGLSIDVILRENYRSVIACQEMKESLERTDSGTLFVLLGQEEPGIDLIRKNESVFKTALDAELNNITLPAEGENARRLRDLFEQYRAVLDKTLESVRPPARGQTIYFAELFPLFNRIKQTADVILQMNQKNMSEANDRARRSAASAKRAMYLLLLGGMVVAVGFVLFTRRGILRPIDRLIQSAEEIKKGNLDLVVPSHSRDEIGRLSAAFNEMAAALRQSRRADQNKLARMQRATEQTFKSLPDAVAIVDPAGKVEVATDTARNVFGLKPETQIRSLPYPWMREMISETFGTARTVSPKTEKMIQQFVDGEEHYFRPEAIPILDHEGLPAGAVLVLKDVTQEREQEELKRGVISTVSHQLNSPLTSIRMAIHLLLDEKAGALTSKQAELLTAARDESDRLSRILSDLLNISRIESGKAGMSFRPILPHNLIFEALEAFSSSCKDRCVNIRAELEEDLPEVRADAAQIGQVFANLLSNALKHTAAGGSVTVRARADDERVTFSVIDTGTGIPEQYLGRIFEPFFRVPDQSPESGAGLGLAIVKEIVEAHGGALKVESRVGEGSVFSFTLPRADRSVEARRMS